MLVVAGGMLTVSGVHAQEHDMAGMAMPVKAAAVVSGTLAAGAESESTKAFKAADAKMHKAMMMTYTGDADVDFLRGMIPHHQGAIDMANIVLKYGTDSEVRMLAGDIVKAQEKEIRMMQDWLAKHGPKDASASDARAEVVPVKPATATVVTETVTSKAVTKAVTKAESIPQPSVDKTVKNVAVPVAEINAAAVTAVNVEAVSVSSVVSGAVPATPSISGTTAMMMDGMPMSMTPDMPAPDVAISNQAPQMDLLDQPLSTKIGDPTGENNAAQ